MASNVQRGAYYKSRTRKWLEAHGWQVGDLEVVRYVGWPTRFPVKHDQFGADLLAVNRDTIVFVQVKSGKSATGNFLPARREFAKYVFPPNCEQYIVAWLPRARAPRIVKV